MPLWWDELSKLAIARVCIPRVSFNCLLPLLEALQDQQVGLIHVPFEVPFMVSAMGLRVCEILCVPFKSRVSISHHPLAPLKVSSTGFQSQMLWGLKFLLQNPMWAWIPLFLGENLYNCNYSPVYR